MKKHILHFAELVAVLLCCILLLGCGGSASTSADPTAAPAAETPAPEETASPEPETPAVNSSGLADGKYSVKFDTDSSMFHINEAYEGRGILTVANGEMTVHITLSSKKIVNLFYGLAEDAKKDGADLIQPTLDSVTYKDGMTEEVYGFDVPVPVIGEEFDCALVGTKGTWYDHKVVVSDPQPIE